MVKFNLLATLALACACCAHAATIVGSGAFVTVTSTSNGTPDSSTFTEDLEITVSGSTGSGWLMPIATVTNTWIGTTISEASIQIGCTFAPQCNEDLMTNYFTGMPTKYWTNTNAPLPFTYNVPFDVTVTIAADNDPVPGLTSSAVLNGFGVWDIVNRQGVSGMTVSYASPAPEPATLWLIGAAGVVITSRRKWFVR